MDSWVPMLVGSYAFGFVCLWIASGAAVVKCVKSEWFTQIRDIANISNMLKIAAIAMIVVCIRLHCLWAPMPMAFYA